MIFGFLLGAGLGIFCSVLLIAVAMALGFKIMDWIEGW